VAYLEDGGDYCGIVAGFDGGAVYNVEDDDAGGGDCGTGVDVGGGDDANGSGVDGYGSGFSGDVVGCVSVVGFDGGAVNTDDGGDGIVGGDYVYGSGVDGDLVEMLMVMMVIMW